MASQKHWQDMDLSQDLGSEDTEEEYELTHEQCEEIFVQECKKWLEQNAPKLVGTGFEKAHKLPWTKKTSSKDFLSQTIIETPSKTPRKNPLKEAERKNYRKTYEEATGFTLEGSPIRK